MSAFFSYAVDGDTMRSCLALCERAAARQERGEPGFIGERINRSRRGGKFCFRKGKHVLSGDKAAIVAQVLKRYAAGVKRCDIAEHFELTMSQVDSIIYSRRRVGKVSR